MLRGGPCDGELCLSAHVVVRNEVSLNVFDLERGLRHEYDAAGTAFDNGRGHQEVYRYRGTFPHYPAS